MNAHSSLRINHINGLLCVHTHTHTVETMVVLEKGGVVSVRLFPNGCICAFGGYIWGIFISPRIPVQRFISSSFVRLCVCLHIRKQEQEQDTDPEDRILDLTVWNLVNSFS